MLKKQVKVLAKVTEVTEVTEVTPSASPPTPEKSVRSADLRLYIYLGVGVLGAVLGGLFPPEAWTRVGSAICGVLFGLSLCFLAVNLAVLRKESTAFVGGLVGMVLLSVATAGFFIYMPSVVAASEDEDELMIDFQPGALVRLGPKPEDLPEKQIVEETRVEEDTRDETVTKEEDTPLVPEDNKKEDPKEKKSKDKVDPNKKMEVKVGERNQESNTPYNELPNVEELSGDPFGDPGGWADLKKDGDPWATAVMKALNGLSVPSYAAKGFSGKYRFEIKICKDGRIDQVYDKGRSGNAELDAAVKGELKKMILPVPPREIADKMKSNCVKLKYRFVWGEGRIL